VSIGGYKVVTTRGGPIAFARNSDPSGCRYTVIVDHGNGKYSLCAHLAEEIQVRRASGSATPCKKAS
jgi:murein DD-endopeptidase MepM/ murein hydrolase activator NlpD